MKIGQIEQLREYWVCTFFGTYLHSSVELFIMKKSHIRQPIAKTIQAMKDAVTGKTIKAKGKKDLFKKLNNS